MLETITVQNFKSLKNVTVKLQKVNLLIGPNNSGKSNFLKAVTFIEDYLDGKFQHNKPLDLNRIYFNQNIGRSNLMDEPILFEFKWVPEYSRDKKIIYHLELRGYNFTNNLVYGELIGTFKRDISDGNKLLSIDNWIRDTYEFYAAFEQDKMPLFKGVRNEQVKKTSSANSNFGISCFSGDVKELRGAFLPGGLLMRAKTDLNFFPGYVADFFNSIRIYKPDPSKISKESLLLFDKTVREDCSNLVAFLDNMRDEYPNIWDAIESDLQKCLPEFEGINFGKVPITDDEDATNIGKRFGLRNKWGKVYWAEELSEGTIYFLALLAIIHQPYPPKLLLLEEPEKGIHPRRISEVMDLIFRLAEEKDIQIIMTAHSTQVVDEFQDIPESVFVFELQDGETKIKNLLTDIIEPDNKDADEKGYPKLDFNKHSLGEHWAIGYLGGVPAK